MPGPTAKRAFATEVVSSLRAAGYTALWAGGCVRDLLLGHVPDDYDVATDATPRQVMGLFRRTVPVGVSFGVVRVLGPREAGEVEVATFRSDLAYVDGRRPEGVVFSSPELDAQRRDFTINGMFYDPIDGQVIDHVGGRADLDARILRAIGDPAARFGEDKLRLLRAARFAARFGFEIEPTTRAALVAMAAEVRVVAPERIAQELRKMLVHPSRARGLRLAFETGLVRAILPDLVPLKGLPIRSDDPGDHDAWEHTLRVLDRLPLVPSAPLAFAALLHAVGMPRARAESEDGVEPLEPTGIAVTIADRIARDLRLSNTDRERVRWLVAHQDTLNRPAELPRPQLKRLLATPGIDELFALNRAIALATGRTTEHVDYCERYRRDQPDGPLDPPPLLTGDDLKQHGLKPGPRFKAILDHLRDEQLDGRLGDKVEALRWVDAHAHEFEPRDCPSG